MTLARLTFDDESALSASQAARGRRCGWPCPDCAGEADEPTCAACCPFHGVARDVVDLPAL